MHARYWAAGLLVLLVAHASHAAGNLLEGDSSFETGYGVWRESGALDDTTAFDGQHSVKLTGRFATEERYTLAGGKTYAFSVYLRAEEPGTKVSLGALLTNWSGDEANAVVTVGPEWQRYSLVIAPKPETSPTVWLRIDRPAWLDQPNRTYWADACQLEEGEMSPYEAAEPVSFACQVESPVPGNVLYPEERVELTFRIYNSRREETATNLRYGVTDYYGDAVQSGVFPLRLSPKENLSRRITLEPLRKKGFYLLTHSLSDERGGVVERTASFCIVARPVPYSPAEGSPFAMSWIAGGREPVAARIGVKWTEARFMWPWIEKERGTLDPDALARAEGYVDLLSKLGINAIGRIARTASWAGEYSSPTERPLPTEDGIGAYESFVYRIVSRSKDKVHRWLSWGGEDDLTVKHYAAKMGQSEDWAMQRMVEMMKAGYRGAKRADPDCVFGGAGQPSGVDCCVHFPYTRKVFALAGEYTDYLGVDCYTWPRSFREGARVQSPEELGFTDILTEALEVAGAKRCWITEYGFAISPQEAMDSPCAKRLADYMARSHLLAASVPRIEMLEWFACWNCVEGGCSYDMWRWPNPLPVVAAYSALAQVLTGATAPQEIPLGGFIKAFAFEKKGGSVAALWAPSNREIPIRLARPAGIRVVDIMGNEVEGDATSLRLTGAPIYLLSDMPVSALAKLLSEAVIDLPPVTVELRLADLRTVTAYVFNQLNVPLEGAVALVIPVKGTGAREVQSSFAGLQPGATEAVEVRLPGEVDIARLAGSPVSGELRTDRGAVEVTQALSLTPCPRATKQIVIDGDLTEWEGRTPMQLRDASHLAPPDALPHNLWTGEEDLSAKAYLAWDDERFYFAAVVRDDVLRNDGGKDDIWSGDSVQIAFDTNNDALRMKAAGYGADDREFSFGYSDKLGGPALCRSWPSSGPEPQANLAVKRQGDRVFYEVAVAFSELGALRPEHGEVFGFNFVIPDRDLGPTVAYWLGLTPGICGGKDPSAFRKFVLWAAE